MKHYLITITMHDGSLGQTKGFYASDWEAILVTMDAFGDAKRISARRLTS